MNKRLLYTAALLLALLIVATAATYAWLFNGDTAKGMKYSIAKIDSSVILYRAIDDNFNGIPNLLEENVARSYYMEQYHFEQMGAEVYALSEDSTANMLTSINLQDVFPTQRYTFKYALTNRSSARNRVLLHVQGDEYLDTALLSTLSLRFGVVESESATAVGQPQWSEKIYFSDYVAGAQDEFFIHSNKIDFLAISSIAFPFNLNTLLLEIPKIFAQSSSV